MLFRFASMPLKAFQANAMTFWHSYLPTPDGLKSILTRTEAAFSILRAFSSCHPHMGALYELTSPLGISPETSSLDTSREASPKASL